LSNSPLSKQFGRISFLFSALLVAFLCGTALHLLRSHAESKRALFAVGYGMVLLGVFWTRSLERRLADGGLPRWIFWPYFLAVFTGCLGAHVLKFTNSRETLALFLLLQLPAALFPSKPAGAESSPSGALLKQTSSQFAWIRNKWTRNVAPLSQFEFAVFVLLIAGLLQILHLLRGDFRVTAHAREVRAALDAGSGLLGVLWVLSARGRLQALGLMRWTLELCFIVLAICVLPLALRAISFPVALAVFISLQVPAVLLRRESAPENVSPPDTDS
jgi:hypothetical protein